MENLSLKQNEYNTYYQGYIEKASHNDIIEGLIDNFHSTVEFYQNLPESKHGYAYDKDKWTVKDILLHLSDTERIFMYRALRIARSDKTEMVGFDQDQFVSNANANSRSLESILDEFKTVRQSTISLFKSFSQSELIKIGKASGSDISVRAIGYILVGHVNHHRTVINERYI